MHERKSQTKDFAPGPQGVVGVLDNAHNYRAIFPNVAVKFVTLRVFYCVYIYHVHRFRIPEYEKSKRKHTIYFFEYQSLRSRFIHEVLFFPHILMNFGTRYYSLRIHIYFER